MSSANQMTGALEEFLAVRFDVSGKAECVASGELFRKLGIALLESLDDGHVLRQGRSDAVRAPDRQLPIPTHMKQDIVCHIDQHRRLAERNQRLVKSDVGP